MKRIAIFLMLFVGLVSCSVNDPIVFDGAFVYIVDESGQASSEVSWEGDKNMVTYNLNLVCPGDFNDVIVYYELIVGDGLKEGVDFRQISSTASPILFPKGIYTMPIRIEWLRHEIDPNKDNTLTISITGCDDKRVTLGKPGPDKIGKNYIITKK